MKHLTGILLVCLLAAIFTVFGGAEGETAGKRLSVVATDFPCYDFARQAAGELADVALLIHPGTEVHTYDPTPADIRKIGQADLFVYIGGESDSWVDGMLDGLGGDGAPARLRMMDVVEPLEEDHSQGEGDAHAAHDAHDEVEYDEHIWTAPRNAMAMALAAGEALANLDPDHADAYRANAAAYAAQFEQIDAEFRQIVDSRARDTLVFADRFPFLYFVRAYGLSYAAAFSACTAETEPSAQTLLRLIRTVREENVPVVYIIEMSTGAVAATLAEETGVEVLTMHSCQTVSQSEFDAGETCASLMRGNVEALRRGLQ